MPSFRNPFTRRKATPGSEPDLWLRCPGCSELLFKKSLEKGLRVCTSCGHHFRVPARERITQLVDEGSFSELDAVLRRAAARDRLTGGQAHHRASRPRFAPPSQSVWLPSSRAPARVSAAKSNWSGAKATPVSQSML